jgi:hypothetical protein
MKEEGRFVRFLSQMGRFEPASGRTPGGVLTLK